MSAYVEIDRPYESGRGLVTVELRFPAASKRRAVQHHHVAWHLADVQGLDMRTPYRVNPRWSVYEENWGNGQRHGGIDERRLTVGGAPLAVAGYLEGLVRVLDAVESLATRAVREFGTWRRSVGAERHLEYEDAASVRVRGREFRMDALAALVGLVSGGTPDGGGRDSSRPLWEQPRVVAAEVWAAAGGVDLAAAVGADVDVHEARMVPVAAEAPVVEAVGGEVVGGEVVVRAPAGGQMELFVSEVGWLSPGGGGVFGERVGRRAEYGAAA